ncbi:hypothetical protein FK535_00485 [Mycolicibacterium sp. 018/SC-01/001]|uniref:hypothetical protein n=1 Tax=Mycolicibacterium sp. 018/SC-01/001 TaxID=2592069 RepID=UPI00118159FE|nr:hypothetical protein [Mycolicibacterium sp. 018/SC-01/001]TRW88799.1 hypothetical protein FK535_00485 [Mycolicibacterium sp. 018/SC-01/001]
MAAKGKVYSARVGEDSAAWVRLIQKLAPGNKPERQVAKDALTLVINSGKRNEAKLKAAYKKRKQSEIMNAGSLSAPRAAASAAEARREAEREEVPAGSAMMVQAEVDVVMHRMLATIGEWTARNESELVRHGLYLLFEEARSRRAANLRKLQADLAEDTALLSRPVPVSKSGAAAAKSTKPDTRTKKSPTPSSDARPTPDPVADADSPHSSKPARRATKPKDNAPTGV